MALIQRALLSVTDKTGVVAFARGLVARGVELISTGGTAKLLKEAGLNSVRDVADVTGFPEMLDGRVKTIHPRVAAGILARRGEPAHMQALAAHEIGPIDMVVVNLYAFDQVAARPGVSFDELIEHIDIGGPTMIRAAAKNFQDVAVVTSPRDYDGLLTELTDSNQLSAATHWRLARQAFALTAAYDRAITARLADVEPHAAVPEAQPLPAVLDVHFPRRLALRYGENPHQSAALYASGEQGIAGARQLHGKELSYNNLVDLDAAWQLVMEFAEPAAAIIKHTNPCGCAEQGTLAEAYRRAYEADPVSAFGGILAVNRELDEATAQQAATLFLEAIAAPAYSAAAMAVLQGKKNLRLLAVQNPASAEPVVKSITGGYLAQTADHHQLDPNALQVVTQRAPSDEERKALLFGWKVCKHVKSNAIVYARAGQSLSVGAGQMSRVDSVKVGAMKAVLPLVGSVLASDAFFPFPDGLEEAARHGITAVIQPGGSVRDQDSIDAADRLGLAMVFTGVRHFRH